MRILMIHPHDIFSSSEPWTRRVVCLAKEFAKASHDVRLVYFPSSGNRLKVARGFRDGYEYIPLPRVDAPIVFLKNIRRLVSLSRWADVVHFQKCHHYAAIPAVFGAYVHNRHLHYDWDDWEEMIWYESCGRSPHALFVGFLFRILEILLPRLADTVSVSSKRLKALALARGTRAEDLCLAPVSVDQVEFHHACDGSGIREIYGAHGILVLYVGQLNGSQHADLLIDAAARVVKEDKDTAFLIVGDGHARSFLERVAAASGLGDNVFFAGAVPPDRIAPYIAAADICVAPFRDTTVARCKSPLKIAEYMGLGKAIVASRVGEIETMVAGAGVLVAPGDAEALAQGILGLIKDPALRKDLGLLARQRSERAGGWASVADVLLGMYAA